MDRDRIDDGNIHINKRGVRMFCPKCGISNSDDAVFCSSCGNALPLAAKGSSMQSAAADGFSSMDEYYKAAVGPKNQDYYLNCFSGFDNKGKTGVTWNWPSFLVTFYWLLYRKMWLNALVYFFLPYLLVILFGIIAVVMGDSSGVLIGTGYLLYLAAIFILIPMYANALYYRHCKKIISEVRASSQDTQRQLGELSGKGGTSNIVLIFVLIFVFVAIIGILAAIAIPAYQDYTTKARTVQAVTFGKTATDSVANFYNLHQAIPNSLEESDFALSLPPSVKALSFNSQNGTVTVTVEGAVVNGKSILFVPSLDAGNQLIWTCMSEEIQDRYLPQECRHKN
jgi:Tfp pilus assembly protein PilE